MTTLLLYLFYALLADGRWGMEYVSDDTLEPSVLPSELMDIAYIKPIIYKGSNLYSVHTADGKQLAVFESYDSAFFAARQNNFAPVSVH